MADLPSSPMSKYVPSSVPCSVCFCVHFIFHMVYLMLLLRIFFFSLSSEVRAKRTPMARTLRASRDVPRLDALSPATAPPHGHVRAYVYGAGASKTLNGPSPPHRRAPPRRA